MRNINKCAEAIDKTVFDLRSQGMETHSIITALADACVQTALFEPKEEAASFLRSVITVLEANVKATRAGSNGSTSTKPDFPVTNE